MSGETGQLQRLTDEQVSARLAAYNARRVARARHQAAARAMSPTSSPPRSSRSSAPERAERLCRQSTPARSTPPGSRASPNMAARSIAEQDRRCRPTSPSARRPPSRDRCRASSSASPAIGDKLEQLHRAPSMRIDTFETDIILAQVALLEADRGRRAARPRERAVRAPRRRPGPRQHRPVQGADRAHPLDRHVGARHARQDQRSRRRRRAVGGRDARSRADRRRPHPRDRGRPYRSRSRGRRRHPRRRPGEPGGEGQPGAVGPRRGDRIDPQPDPRHRRPDQSARAQRHHRGGARRRCRPRLRGRRAGSEEPRHARPRGRPTTSPPRSPRSSRRPARRSKPTARSRARSRKCRPRPTASARRWSCRRRR